MRYTLPSKSLLYICFAILVFTINVKAQSMAIKTRSDTLLIGVAGNEPFVFEGRDGDEGIAVEIWEKLAKKQGWVYTYKSFATVDAALHALEINAIDIAIGPISITSQRLEFLQFSQPFYNSSLAIVSRADTLTLWEKIKPLFSFKLFTAILIFLVILAIVGALLWLTERKKSPEQFPKDPVNGIGNGMWLAIVTMSTTGYGDKAPITLWGRIVAGSWMIISIIFATSMVAGIASTLTLTSLSSSTVNTIEQLSSKKAVTISGSPAEVFLNENNIKVTGVKNLDDAITKLKNKEVNAVVYDRPQLLYFLKKNYDESLYLAKAEYFKQGYGFAFSPESTLVFNVNRTLLELAEDQEIQRIIDYYLKKDI